MEYHEFFLYDELLSSTFFHQDHSMPSQNIVLLCSLGFTNCLDTVSWIRVPQRFIYLYGADINMFVKHFLLGTGLSN